MRSGLPPSIAFKKRRLGEMESRLETGPTISIGLAFLHT
jgi:hypothetical protein